MELTGSSAIVTGGASGIGAALVRALVARGDDVVAADLDGPGAAAVAEAATRRGPGTARGVTLDVRDADAVRAVVEEAHAARGRLDLVVNNAGIGVGGYVEDLTPAHWDRVIDVNLRGVVHGVAAAYPVMVRQGSGQIANTASITGLVPTPLLTPYAMTKHAVVGLSLSLRGEAALHGVRVSVVCPGAVDTPILDRRGPADLPDSGRLGDPRAYITRLAGRPISPDALAREVLAGLDRDRAVIVAPRRARVAWRAQRLAPGLVERAGRSGLRWAARLSPG